MPGSGWFGDLLPAVVAFIEEKMLVFLIDMSFAIFSDDNVDKILTSQLHIAVGL